MRVSSSRCLPFPFDPKALFLYAGGPLVKDEARKQGKEHAHIDFALIFDQLERDHDVSPSRAHWPVEQRVWDWIIYASATVPTVPFSLEDLALSKTYDGQTNPQYIEPADEEIIRPYLQWALAEVPQADRQLILPQQLVKQFGAPQVLVAIKNHDRIIERRRAVPTRLVQVEQYVRNEWLKDELENLLYLSLPDLRTQLPASLWSQFCRDASHPLSRARRQR